MTHVVIIHIIILLRDDKISSVRIIRLWYFLHVVLITNSLKESFTNGYTISLYFLVKDFFSVNGEVLWDTGFDF